MEIREETPNQVTAGKIRGTDMRLLPVAVITWLGTIVGLTVIQQNVFTVVLTIVGVIIGVGIMVFPHTRIVGVMLAACSIAVMDGSHFADIMRVDPLTIAAAEQRHIGVIGTINSHPQPSSSQWKKDVLTATMSVDAIQVEEKWVPSRMSARIEINNLESPLDAAWQHFPHGTRIILKTMAQEPVFSKGNTVATFNANEYQILGHAPQWRKTIAKMRYELGQVTQKAAGSVGPLISGMAIGDDVALDRRTKEGMLTASLTHLTAVSGTHIAISLAVIYVALAGRPKTQSILIALFLLAVIAVVGAQPSVIRATFMSSLVAWGMFRRRPGQPLALLFVVIIVVLLIEPWNALSLGFALSSISTFGILTLGRYLSHKGKTLIHKFTSHVWKKTMMTVIDALAISCSAYAVSLPILVLINPWLPTWGIIGNLAVAPIVAPLTLLGVSVAVLSVPWSTGAYWLAKAASPLAWWMERVALSVDTWPMSRMPWPQGISGSLLLTVLLTLGFSALVTIGNATKHRLKVCG